ncbi:hypothetical protein SRHO_G00087860 [Serrasalmus rhombeus]
MHAGKLRSHTSGDLKGNNRRSSLYTSEFGRTLQASLCENSESAEPSRSLRVPVRDPRYRREKDRVEAASGSASGVTVYSVCFKLPMQVADKRRVARLPSTSHGFS